MGSNTQLLAQPKIEELESIRGLAALLMVFYHIPKWHPALDMGIINNGYLMVELFFVISGFVIFTAYADRIKDRKDLLRFQFLRSGRLYPVHLIFLLVFVFIEIAKYLAKAKFGISSTNSTPFTTNDFEAFVKNLFLIQSVLPNQPLTFNYPSWSISVEFYTYLVFGVSVLLFNGKRVQVFMLLATLSLFMLVAQLTFGYDTLIRCFAGFFVGCLTAAATRNLRIALPAFVSFAVAAAMIAFLSAKTTKVYDPLIYLLTAALIASLILSPESSLKRLLSLKALTWLGAISYSVYMSHAAIEWAANQFLRVVLKRPEVLIDGKSIPQLSGTETFIACAAIAWAVLSVSSLVYIYVEKPWRERSRHFAAARLT